MQYPIAAQSGRASTRSAPRTSRVLALALPLLLALAGCGGGGNDAPVVQDSAPPTAAPTPTPTFTPSANLSQEAQLGQQIFHDTSLSASGRMACATCHAADTGHASPFTTPVAMGGAQLDQPGVRNSPPLGYLRFNGPLVLSNRSVPSGGFHWDGRAANLREQARAPFLNPVEMANRDAADVVAKLAAAPYAAQFKAVYGADILRDPEAAFERMAMALQLFQQQSSEFAQFTSKFDAVTAGRAAFSPSEERGLALFNSPDKGNCTECHSSAKPFNAPAAVFTDYRYANLGVPRNAAIPANADPAFFDRGLCDSTRADLAGRTDLCGSFKVPTLRNVAVRKRFFHNGVFDSLEQVVRFYARRDIEPQAFYPPGRNGAPVRFNDLPPELRSNVLTTVAPFNRTPAQGPALTEAEIADVVAFLRTLTDGYNAER
jgi:cytochrome c peroxidase